MSSTHTLIRHATILGLAGGIAATSTADFVTRRYTSGTNFELVMSNMPDFDQVRIGLDSTDDGEPGGHFCVPTSVANLFAYTAIHGYPGCAPGLDSWDTNTGDYAVGTDFIARLGSEMNTRGEGGTTFGPAFRGTRRVKNAELGARFVVTRENRGLFNEVTLRELAIAGICHREIQEFAYGKYELRGVNARDEQVIWRTGGHAMTLVGAARNGSDRNITYHNPDDDPDDDPFTQSVVRTRSNPAPWITDLVIAPNIPLSYISPRVAMTQARNPSDDSLRLLDSRIGLRPACGYSWGTFDNGDEPRTDVGSIVLTWGVNAAGDDREHEFVPLSDLLVEDGRLTLSPTGSRAFLDRTHDRNRLLVDDYVDPAQGAGPMLTEIDLGPLDLPPIDDIRFSTDHTLVLQCGHRLIALGGLASGLPSEEDPQPFVAWESEVPFQIGGIVALGWGGGWDWDEDFQGHHAPHSILAISSDGLLAAECWSGQEGDPIVRQLPPLGLDGGRIADTFAQVDSFGTIWFATKGDPRLRALLPDGRVIDRMLDVQQVEGLAIDDLDHLLVSDAGFVRCFRFGPNGLEELGREASPFAGEIVGRDFVIDRSSTNHDPTYHTVENGWFDIIDDVEEQDESPCPGDFDGDGRVDGADFGTLLGTWGLCDDCPTDLDGNGRIDGADMGLLLGFWGECDPQP